jgi:hypothetical protein
MLPSLDKRDLEELAQSTSSMYKLISSKKTFLIARDAWKDHVQEPLSPKQRSYLH